MPYAVIRHFFLALSLTAGAALVLPAPSAEASICKSKKKSKKAKAKKKVKAAKPAKKQKLTAAQVVGWHKGGASEDEIVARAEQAGWKPSAADEKVMKTKKLPPTLIAALTGKPIQQEKVDLTKPASVSDINFDEVPPPAGTVASAAPKPAAAPARAPAKQIDHSTRPNAPFDEKNAEAAPAAAPQQQQPTMRKVIVAKDS